LCVSDAAVWPDHPPDRHGPFTNITHSRDALAMVVPKHRRPADLGRSVDADENIDPEVERAQSRGTESICYR
jgi:hypothetical protein